MLCWFCVSLYDETQEVCLDAVVTIAKALADANRLRILFALDGRELCVCQITEFLSLAPSTTSKHLSILRHARLITSRKDSRWMYYSLAAQDSAPEVKSILAWVRQSLDRQAGMTSESRRLEKVLKLPVESLCGT